METLSTNSKMFIDEDSSHGIPIEDPGLVVRSVREVYSTLKTHTTLNTGKMMP